MGYFVIDEFVNDYMDNPNISLSAKGLLTVIYDRHYMTLEEAYKACSDTREEIDIYLSELIKAGYLEVINHFLLLPKWPNQKIKLA